MAFRALVTSVLVILAAPASSKEIRLTLREGTNFAAAQSALDRSFFLDLHGTLWRLPAEGGKATAMTDGLGDDRLPDVSRDGSRIVFQSYRNGTWDIWSIATDGSSAAALTEGPADDREPVLSPDGSRVAFSSDRSGNYDVWILDLSRDTWNPVRVRRSQIAKEALDWLDRYGATAFEDLRRARTWSVSTCPM